MCCKCNTSKFASFAIALCASCEMYTWHNSSGMFTLLVHLDFEFMLIHFWCFLINSTQLITFLNFLHTKHIRAGILRLWINDEGCSALFTFNWNKTCSVCVTKHWGVFFNHCCFGKVTDNKYYECVYLYSCLSYLACKVHIFCIIL